MTAARPVPPPRAHEPHRGRLRWIREHPAVGGALLVGVWLVLLGLLWAWLASQPPRGPVNWRITGR